MKEYFQQREQDVKQIGWSTLQSFASESYEAMFSAEAEFNKQMVGRAFAYAGSQLGQWVLLILQKEWKCFSQEILHQVQC